jgi:hypothetical protein
MAALGGVIFGKLEHAELLQIVQTETQIARFLRYFEYDL